MLFQIAYKRNFLFFVIHVLNLSQIHFLQTSSNLYKIMFCHYLSIFFFLLRIVEAKWWWWSVIPTSHVSKLLNKSSWFVNVKSMHVGFVNWKYSGDVISDISKCLFSIVKLKSPINNDKKIIRFNLVVCNNPQIAI